MAVRAVTREFAVADQILPEEIAGLAGRFAVLINNRPDGEEPGQPTHAAIEAAAREAGLAYCFAPVVGAPGPDQVEVVRQALEEATGPVLAFCRSGTRSIITWALVQGLEGRPVEALVAEGAAAGYDLRAPLAALLPRLGA